MAPPTTSGPTRTTPVPPDGGSGAAISAAKGQSVALTATARRPHSDSFSGSAVAAGTGMSAVARIPIPGTDGLYLELKPRGKGIPKTGSTSTIFLQDIEGRRQLRLDYGRNPRTNKIDYHWNQDRVFKTFGIQDHTPVGEWEAALYKGAKWFRYGGRVLLLAGAAADIYSIAVARDRWRQAAKVASGWAGSWAGCEGVGALGAAGGSFVEPGVGTAVGGFAGCIVGGVGGYFGASWAAGHAYEWVKETYFEAIPEEAAGGKP